MTDVTQGADAPDDASLFSDATTTTLEKFENAEPLPPQPVEPKPVEKVEPPKAVEPPKPEEADAPVPAGRLREVAERARKAERERDELMRQLQAVASQRPQQPPPPKPDVFENPSGFVRNEVQPFLEQINQRMQMQTEANSKQWATSTYGREKVEAAEAALGEGMKRRDPAAKAVWDAAMADAHPYDIVTRWHINNETMKEVGGDLAAYKKRVLEEALTDPEHQRQVFAASKGNAQHVARPVPSSVPKIPSLGNVGAGAGGEADLQEPSDDQLFRAATTAKRR